MFKLLILSGMMLWAISIYDFKVPSLEGTEIDFSAFKGKNMLIVNTASECGYTPQYADLQKLHKEHEKDLVIVGFPANNFGGQEPGSNEEIQSFCQKNYGVTFPMAAKVSVKGKDIHPLFKYLTDEAKKLGVEDPIKWNFTKFLVNPEGKLVAVFDSKTTPGSDDIAKYLN